MFGKTIKVKLPLLPKELLKVMKKGDRSDNWINKPVPKTSPMMFEPGGIINVSNGDNTPRIMYGSTSAIWQVAPTHEAEKIDSKIDEQLQEKQRAMALGLGSAGGFFTQEPITSKLTTTIGKLKGLRYEH